MELKVINNGPYLTFDDIKPHIKRKVIETISSQIPGLVGPLKIIDKSLAFPRLVVKAGKRQFSIDFSRGDPVMIVEIKGKTVIITKRRYDSIKAQLATPILGS